MKRLDDLNRTERYFTSTLFGGLLIHNDLLGVRKFLTWLINEKEVFLHVVGDPNAKPRFVLPVAVPEHIEVNTEFNTKRDLKYYNKPSTDLDVSNFSERQNVPDVIIIYGEALIVIEGKFFVSGQTATVIDQQLQMQKEEIELMIDYLKPQIKYWLHIYLGPNPIKLSNCDLQLTWNEIELFSKVFLGDHHYITERLHYANVRYFEKNMPSTDKYNYSGKCSFSEIVRLCENEGDKIIVGFTGGISGLYSSDYNNLVYRDFKWDNHKNIAGKTITNWLNGTKFLQIINKLAKNNNSVSKSTNLNSQTKSRNYTDTADFAEIKALCRTYSENILVGFTGGKNGLQIASLTDLENRKFKYDFKNKLQGKKTMSNWINGLAFHNIIVQKTN